MRACAPVETPAHALAVVAVRAGIAAPLAQVSFEPGCADAGAGDGVACGVVVALAMLGTGGAVAETRAGLGAHWTLFK